VKTFTHRRRRALPMMMAEMVMASWETIARRTALIARGACTSAEYQRMIIEKAAAFERSAMAMITARGKKAVLAPWHRRATANARRLRRKT
jgi:hypothetical protein